MTPAPATGTPVGNSQLELAVNGARPQPPDVPTENLAPGGQLIPLTPYAYHGETIPTTRRNEYALQFQAAQGQQLAVRRIYLSLPVELVEDGVEETEESTVDNYSFETEAERNQWVSGKGGQATGTQTTKPIGYSTPYEKTHTEEERARSVFFQAIAESKTKYERSILPITVTVTATLYGPTGALWSEDFDVELHQTSGSGPGSYVGRGQIGAYADLTNPIPLRPDQEQYGIGLAIFIPTKAETHPVIGVNAEGNGAGQIILLYDIENVPLGK